MSTNRFTHFSAGGGGGWMKTKRRGKDDDQIERDRKIAAEARKNARRRNGSGATSKTSASRKKSFTKRTNKKFDEENDLDGFIIDDDEELDEVEESSSSSEEEALTTMRRKPLKTAHKKLELELSSEDEDEPSFLGSFSKRISRPPTKQRPTLSSSGRFHEEKKQDLSSDSELEIVSKSAPTSSRFFKRPADDSDDEDLTPIKPGKRKKSAPLVCLQDSSDEDIPVKKPARVTDHIGCEDDDEAIAMAWAIAESEKEQSRQAHQPRKRLKNGIKKRKKARRPVVAELSEEDDEEETNEDMLLEESSSGEDEEQDAYEEQASEAGSVLKAANNLSAKVLQTMVGWFQEDGGETVPTGIIVDGALSMHECVQNASNHSWISQELMKTICPEVTLADYQLIGVNWLALLHGMTCEVEGKKKGTNVNGVLADEMGLGKTVQTITFLAWLRYQNRRRANEGREPDVIALDDESDNAGTNTVSLLDDDGSDGALGEPYCRPHIIIVPASVLSNWEREFDKFCPDMYIIKYHGSMAEREVLQEKMRQYLPGRQRGQMARPPLDVVLTTFSYFSSEKSDDRNFLRKFRFDYMVVDEAHCLKNPRGMRYRNLDKFETSHRLLLTGTPVQNSPKELMSLLCFLMPLFSRTKEGNGFDSDDIKNDGGERMIQHFVSLESSAVTKDDANDAAYKKLKQLFAPFVLRRRKVDVLSQIMPPKTRRVELVPFDNATRMVYDSILAAHINRRENASTSNDASSQQHLFTSLRKAANHPLLLRTRHTSGREISHLAKHLFKFGYFGRHETCTEKHVRNELENFSDFDIHCAALELIQENPFRRSELERYTLEQKDMFSSPKFVKLRELLPELIEKGHRVLIFSQWTRCMDLLGCLLESLDMKFLRLDGSTAIAERQKLIDTFNQDNSIPVFLLSTRAGGMGINLTAADVCILHDLDFNPFNDIQAEDRCHRIGQKKPVTVIKMVTEGTVDADIYEMQQKKAKMNAAILESGKENGKAKKEQEVDMNNILKSAVNRFLSPDPKSKVEDDEDEQEDAI